MTELRISEVILSNRRKKNLTQEGLALALGVSPQAVSNWERGGYPDITMLPNIANFFEITVDELIGNDKIGQEKDIESLYERIGKMDDPTAEAELWMEYIAKYPKHHNIAANAASHIFYMPKDKREKYLPELRNICERLINESTRQWHRENAIRYMSALCDESELEKWLGMCPYGYEAVSDEVLEERLWELGKHDESRRQFDINNLHILCHFMFRSNRNWAAPERATDRFKRLIKLIEFFGDGGEIPEGWCGKYANLHFRAGCSSFGCGRVEDGYAYLEKAFELYPRWFDIPNGSALGLGAPDIFGGVKIVKNDWQLVIPPLDENGEPEQVYFRGYGYVFDDGRDMMYNAMTAPNGWEWFNGVRNDEKFKAYIERAKVFHDEYMADNPEE